ncbi:GntR family transcriptional regulator [Rhizobium jaguaris]|uniref:hypothetical protein n=1 Tax=Rhizobium jaguaris TaxID=1312183 RepID=UPI0039BFD59F
MPNRQDKRGRRKGGPPFVMLRYYLLDSHAWGALSVVERCTYLALARRFDGKNNGFISFSVREGAEAFRVSKNTISRALRRLAELGFIEVTQEGSFNCKVRHATEYRLTDYACDRTNKPPSEAFMKWRPDIANKNR